MGAAQALKGALLLNSINVALFESQESAASLPSLQTQGIIFIQEKGGLWSHGPAVIPLLEAENLTSTPTPSLPGYSQDRVLNLKLWRLVVATHIAKDFNLFGFCSLNSIWFQTNEADRESGLEAGGRAACL